MKVICITQFADIQFLAEKSKSFEDDIVIGSEYLVYGMTLWNSIMWYLVIRENNSVPFWLPSDLFKVSDRKLSRHWAYSVNPVKLNSVTRFIWGYEPLADLSDHFDHLLDHDESAIKVFSNYKELMDLEFPDPSNSLVAKSIDESDWILCPECSNAAEANNRDAMFRCLTCRTISHNPKWVK